MKNKFTIENSAMLLIDHQQGTIKLARNLPYEEIVQNTRALARTAIETKMPIVLTSSMEDHFQGLLLDDLQKLHQMLTRSGSSALVWWIVGSTSHTKMRCWRQGERN